MGKLKSIGIPVLLLVLFGAGIGALQHLMYKETHDVPDKQVDLTPKDTKKSNAKKATFTPGRVAVMETSKGTIKFVLYEKDAPISTSNFINLVQRKFYSGNAFHRVVKDFVIQAGKTNDPKWKLKPIKLEIVEGLDHVEGAVGMARTSVPDSASSEFYITLMNHHELDGNYAVFGKVIEGMGVAKKINEGDKIKSIVLTDAPPAVIDPEAKPVGNNKP